MTGDRRGVGASRSSFSGRVESGITRRGFLAGAGSLLLLGAAGCGGGEDQSSGGSQNTRTIEHRYGTTEVEGTPERVVTVGYTDQDSVLALGVTPIAMREWILERAIWPWSRDELGDADPETLSATELNFEQIAALEPDLIVGVGSGMTGEEYETLSEIAPTLARPDEYVDFGVPWQEATRVIGRALGREERAEELVAEVEARFEEARRQHPEFAGASGVVAQAAPDATYFAYGPQDSRGRFLGSLGFELPPEIAELAGDEFYATISEERLDLLDADVLVWIGNNEAPDPRATLEDNQIYGQLDVAREGRDLFLGLDPLGAALSFSTVLSLPFTLDKLVPRLAAAVDGDPDTEAEETIG